VIVAPGTPAAVAVKQATGIPIVFVGVVDAIGSGLAAHFGRPTANITGLTSRAPSSTANAWNF
jgi:putative tryptophan/tyrosine transport system substrate-binding protein